MNTDLKIRIFNGIEILKRKLYILRPVLRPLYRRFVVKRQRQLQNDVFNQNAIDVLDCFNKCLTLHNVNYTLAFGTLLGAVREKGFIKHDHDIDTSIWADEYNPKIKAYLEDVGFKLDHEYLVDSGKLAREETYVKDGVSIDIFYIYPAIDRFPYACDFLNHVGKESFSDSIKRYSDNMFPRRIQLPFSKKIRYTQFETLLLPIPENAEEILACRYGEDYMIPNKGWSAKKHSKEMLYEWHEMKVEVHKYD